MEDFGMDTGVLDAEFVDSSTADTGGESTALATTDQTTGTETQETAAEGAETALATTGPVALTTAPGKLSEPIRLALDAVKAANPAASAALTRTVHQMDTVRREFPGGMKELRELKARAEEMDAIGPIEQTRKELAGFREYDRQFMAGDPKFVETMIAAEPQAFQKLAPMMFSKFAELNPEGMRSLVAKSTMQDMVDSRLPVQLDMMSYLLTELAQQLHASQSPLISLANRAIESFNNGPHAYFSKVDADGKKQIAAPVAPAKADTSLAEREMSLTRREWSMDTNQPMTDIFRGELKALLGAKKVNETELRNYTRMFSMDMQEKLTATPDYEQKSNAYLQAKDREGYKRYQVSMFKQFAPAILRKIVGRPAPPKVNGAAPAAPGAPATPNPAPANGFLFTAAPPKSHEIDTRQTTSQMIDQNRAVLRDGRKVQWKM